MLGGGVRSQICWVRRVRHHVLLGRRQIEENTEMGIHASNKGI